MSLRLQGRLFAPPVPLRRNKAGTQPTCPQGERTMAKGGKLKEVEQLISIDGDKGYLSFDEVNDISTNDIVSSDQIDDVLMMFDEMDIDVVEDERGLKSEGDRILEKEEEGEELDVGSLGKVS